MMRTALLLIATSACSILLGACVPGQRDYYGTTVPRHGPDEVWTNNHSEPGSIDPNKCADEPGGVVIGQVFSGLTQAHPVTLRPLPDLAQSREISNDGRIYTFRLRDTVSPEFGGGQR